MTDQERIARLEQMVLTLTETLIRMKSVVNTGSYEYNLTAVRSELTSDQVEEFA